MISSISTLAAREALRTASASTQVRLAEATAAVSSGRHHDVGLVLGVDTAQTISMRLLVDELDTLAQTNGGASSHLAATQSALNAISDLAEGFFAAVIGHRNGGGDRGLLVADARERLAGLAELLATSSAGAYIFGGSNLAVKPFLNYLAEPSGAGRTAVQAAFATEFGFSADDPQASSITPAALATYLSGSFSGNFADPAWAAGFSAASDSPIRIRIGLGELAEVPVSANSPAIRTLMSALVAVVDSGTEHLDAEAFRTLSDHVAGLASRASGELATSRALVGMVEERIVSAGERLAFQRSLLEREIGRFEDVDPAQASARLSLLSTKLQMSYAATVRLQSLSILDYL